MSRRPRTPVHFPRMKPRGWRAKARLAHRVVEIFVMPHATLERHTGGLGYTFRPVATGGMRIELERWTDGYGRRVPKPRET